MSKLISFETAKLAAEVQCSMEATRCYLPERKDVTWWIDVADKTFYNAYPREELSDWLRENHKMFISITPVVINSIEDITFKGSIFYFKDCWRLAPALNSTDYDNLYEDLLYKALTIIQNK